MPTLMETTLKFDCTRLEEQVLINANKDTQIDTKIKELEDKDAQLDTRVTTLEGKGTPAYIPRDLDLNTGIVAVTYDTADGISLTTQGTIKSNTGTDDVVVDYEIPIIAGDGISIDKKANADKIEVKIDPFAVIRAEGFVTYDSIGNRSYLYPDNLQYWDKEGNQYTLFFPPESGPLTTENSFKTLFGNKNIVGTGNIDLFLHDIKFKATNTETTIRLIVISSKNVIVDSLTDLKTLLGNTFEYPCSGADSNGEVILFVKDNGYRTATDIAKEEYTFYPAGTWTDNVTTV